jgi:hypothetical protein
MQTSYQFSDRERLYFDRLQQQFNIGLMSGIQMIVTQQGLGGSWRIKADGSGIERADLFPMLDPPEEALKKAEMGPRSVSEPKIQKDGVA